MKKTIVLLFCVVLCACRPTIAYQPNTNAIDPAKTIQRIIRLQPPAWTTVPYEISVTEDCIQMKLTEKNRKT
jgi:hypothetical protein